ncbi:hypothetical protein GY45DRAFT_1373960 [Cubamyces sp. BRFM 1775]|nr:hypothetical protein GY45DRAFT_1373960 [Cubamyces sp. BRFM 1775]
MSVSVREVSNVSDADLDKYTKLLAEAFHYQFFGGALGNDRSLQEPMIRAHIAAALVPGEGEVHVAELPDVGVVGVAVWFGPGQKFLVTDAQRNAGWNQLMERLPDQYRDWWSKFLADYDTLVEKSLGGAEVKLGGYHLQLIGVAPEHQRKGVATALIKHAEAKAHTKRVPTLLETVGPTNVAIYKALKFEVAGSGPLAAPPPAQGSFEMFVFIKHTESDEYAG